MKFFPSSVGNQWFFTYDLTEFGATTAGLSTVSVTGTRSIRGTTATVLAREDAETGIGTLEDYYGISLGGITYLGNNDAEDTITPQLLPWVELLFPVSIGTMSTVTGTNLPFGTDGSGNPATLDVTQRIQNTAFEPINVPAGNFGRALRQVTHLDATAKSTQLNQSIAVSGTETTWAVPGVGVVRTASSTTVDVETSGSVAELRGYVVDGVRYGYGLPFTLIPDLSPVFAGDPSPPYGLPAIATDGEHFLVVSRRITGQAPEYFAQWIASLVTLDGTMLSTVDLGSPRRMADPSAAQQAAVAFDGTNYLVVTEQDNNFASTGNHMSLVATRVSAAGAVLGASVEVAPPGSNSPILAFDGARYLLAYRSAISYDNFGPISAVFVDPATGQAIGSAVPGRGRARLPDSPGRRLRRRQLSAWSGSRPGTGQPARRLCGARHPGGHRAGSDRHADPPVVALWLCTPSCPWPSTAATISLSGRTTGGYNFGYRVVAHLFIALILFYLLRDIFRRLEACIQGIYAFEFKQAAIFQFARLIELAVLPGS